MWVTVAKTTRDGLLRNRKKGRNSKLNIPLRDRAALSPADFASLFGRVPVWAYRRIWDGSIKVVPGIGRKMIPQSEVQRLLDSAEVYNGADKVKEVGQ